MGTPTGFMKKKINFANITCNQILKFHISEQLFGEPEKRSSVP